MKELPPPTYIASPEALRGWVQRLQHAREIAVDTESDSFHHYQEKVCLIQMTALGEDVIIDPLALPTLEPLRGIFADRSRVKIFHDAGYDLVCLSRDFEFELAGLFDTMVASRLLGLQHFGLASILSDRFEFAANKRLQRSDWAQRPLTSAQVSYARFDTHFLPELRRQLTRELESSGRLAWAEEDFARLPEIAARNVSRSNSFDANGFWRVRGVKSLTPAARGRVRALYQVRDRIAQRLDRPPFKVFSDAVIVDLAKSPPRGLKDMPRPGLRRAGADRFGEEVLKALGKAKPIPGKPPPGTSRRRRAGRFLDPNARKRYEALRDCRKREAEKLRIDPEVVLPNATLEVLAKKNPKDRSAFVYGELEGWRQEIFADPIIAALEKAGER